LKHLSTLFKKCYF